MKASAELFKTKTKPSLLISSQNGNMYTPSVYGCLASLIAEYVSQSASCLTQSVHSECSVVPNHSVLNRSLTYYCVNDCSVLYMLSLLFFGVLFSYQWRCSQSLP
ncbi:hypothetical protein AMECASPLE_026912 [Ameca splendens]|uniref:Hydroxymethylglutaryl-coenzyme A synthase C-terminal domain-containing protein n=1 Tax=Ameca splendens TaxID=208324 RepID=A0ABV0ZF91_9TELE